MTDTSDKKTLTRRGFLTKIALGAAALPILNRIGGFDSLAYAQSVPNKPLESTDPLAVTMGYVEDHTKVDLTKWPKKAGPDGAKQSCKNCVLFQEGGKKIDGHPGEWGRCGLFQTGLVNANGWCNSFAPKPA